MGIGSLNGVKLCKRFDMSLSKNVLLLDFYSVGWTFFLENYGEYLKSYLRFKDSTKHSGIY